VVLPNRGGEDGGGRTPKKAEKAEVEEDDEEEDSDASEDNNVKLEDENGEQKPDDINVDAATRKMQHIVEAKFSEHARGLKVKD